MIALRAELFAVPPSGGSSSCPTVRLQPLFFPAEAGTASRSGTVELTFRIDQAASGFEINLCREQSASVVATLENSRHMGLKRAAHAWLLFQLRILSVHTTRFKLAGQMLRPCFWDDPDTIRMHQRMRAHLRHVAIDTGGRPRISLWATRQRPSSPRPCVLRPDR